MKQFFSNSKTVFNLNFKDYLMQITFFNLAIVLGQTLYILFRIQYVNSLIPFWFSMPWGDYQLAPKNMLYYLPLTSLLLTILGLAVVLLSRKYFIRYLSKTVFIVLLISNLLIFYSVFKIIISASVPFEPLVNPLILNLAVPFLISFGVAYLLLPPFIEYARDNNLVTNPNIHNHPAMILSKPSARGAGIVYSAGFVAVSLIFTGFNSDFFGIYLSVFMLAMLAFFDDFQNTHVNTTFKILENPILRLFLLFCAVSPVILSGVKIDYVGNPFDGILLLDTFKVMVAGSSVPLISVIITLVWIVWVMNVLSWSNGIDGQFSGILGIACIIVAVLALRFSPLQEIHRNVAVLAIISGGIAFGSLRYMWYPSQIMWGFGAMAGGLVLSVLSILIQGKILTSVLIILIPFLDAVVTVVRRLLQKKNPMKGDRGHLHHLLLEKGWSAKRIAVFYWFTTAVFGAVGVLTAEQYSIQVVLTLGGLVAFFIVLMNVQSLKEKQPLQLFEK